MALFDPKTRTLKIEADTDTVEDFLAMCDDRGLTREQFFRVMVKSFNKRPSIFDLNDELTFGKYRGLITEEVIRADSSYMRWLTKTSTWFKLAPAADRLLQEMEED